MIIPGVWPAGWRVVELNPAHVTAQRRVNGSRAVKTDRIDLTAIADLLLTGLGVPVVVGDAPLASCRRGWRIASAASKCAPRPEEPADQPARPNLPRRGRGDPGRPGQHGRLTAQQAGLPHAICSATVEHMAPLEAGQVLSDVVHVDAAPGVELSLGQRLWSAPS